MVVYFVVAKYEIVDIFMRKRAYSKPHWMFKLKFVYRSLSLNGVVFIRHSDILFDGIIFI